MRTNLKLFRVKESLSQAEIADKIGYGRSAYTAIEAGERDGRQDFWNALQKAFEIPDAEMWGLMKDEK